VCAHQATRTTTIPEDLTTLVAEKEKKMTQRLPVLKAAVLGWKGPLVEGEINRTKGYASELAAKLKEEKV
jgi:hypothetical protein